MLHAFPFYPSPSFLLCWTKVYVTVKFFERRFFFFSGVLLWSVSSNTFLKSFCTQCRARLKEGRLWVNTIPGATLHTPRYQVWVCVHSSTHHALKHKIFSLICKALVVYITCPALYRVVQWPYKAYCTLHLPEKKEYSIKLLWRQDERTCRYPSSVRPACCSIWCCACLSVTVLFLSAQGGKLVTSFLSFQLPPSALHESSYQRSGPHPRSLHHAFRTALFDNGKLLTSVISPCQPHSLCC